MAPTGAVGEAGAVKDTVSFLAFVGVLAALVWLGWRYEPHWCSKDGQHFTARTRPVFTDGHLRSNAGRDLESGRATLLGAFSGGGGGGGGSSASAFAQRWRDARVFVDGDRVQLITRVGRLRRPLPPARVVARAESPHHRRAVYLIESDPLREIRLPTSSRAVAVLDELVARTSGATGP